MKNSTFLILIFCFLFLNNSIHSQSLGELKHILSNNLAVSVSALEAIKVDRLYVNDGNFMLRPNENISIGYLVEEDIIDIDIGFYSFTWGEDELIHLIQPIIISEFEVLEYTLKGMQARQYFEQVKRLEQSHELIVLTGYTPSLITSEMRDQSVLILNYVLDLVKEWEEKQN